MTHPFPDNFTIELKSYCEVLCGSFGGPGNTPKSHKKVRRGLYVIWYVGVQSNVFLLSVIEPQYEGSEQQLERHV